VCDADGRFHDVGNLYAADGARASARLMAGMIARRRV
jgi:hypothetical protein